MYGEDFFNFCGPLRKHELYHGANFAYQNYGSICSVSKVALRFGCAKAKQSKNLKRCLNVYFAVVYAG